MDSPHDDVPPSTRQSPKSHDSDVYGTSTSISRDDGAAMKVSEKDAQLVVGAGRSLKNMLVDLMGVLENQANSKIFIEGDVTLRVDGRDAYTIKLFNEDHIEPSNLKVRIDNTSLPVNNMLNSSTADKRKSDHVDEMLGDDPVESSSKRARTDEPTSIPSNELETPEERDESDFGRIMSKFQNISSQIKWVEECRRIAGEAHNVREEKWRATSATFHDDGRKARERHESWVVAEMGWQRNMLIQLANDVKGLYPLTHSLKWETPPQLVPPSSSSLSMPLSPVANNKPLGKPYIPKTMKSTTKLNGPKT